MEECISRGNSELQVAYVQMLILILDNDSNPDVKLRYTKYLGLLQGLSLKYVELNAQGRSYFSTASDPFIKFNVPLNAEALDRQQIVATAVYDLSDTTKFPKNESYIFAGFLNFCKCWGLIRHQVTIYHSGNTRIRPDINGCFQHINQCIKGKNDT